MPKVTANRITMNYDQQGTGEPLILIPYLAADHACYAFQVPAYARHFTSISVDLRGTGESDKPQGAYTTELLADDVAAFMQAMGIAKAHVAGLSLGGAVGMWLAVKHPDKVASLSVHSGWTRSDRFLQTVVESWQIVARAVDVPAWSSGRFFRGASRPSSMTRGRITSNRSRHSFGAGRRNPCRISSSSRMQSLRMMWRHIWDEFSLRRTSPSGLAINLHPPVSPID
jgi:pimeloyl-ACP methyl ester carboxylesterase